MKLKTLLSKVYTGMITLAALTTLASCQKEWKHGTLEFEDFKYLWLAGATSTPKSLSISTETGRDTTVTIGGLRYGGTTQPYSTDITAVVEVDPSLVAAYNASNATEYVAIPAGAVSLSSTLTIPAGTFASEPLQITVKNNALLEPGTNYLIPVSVKSASAPDGLPLNENLKTEYIVLKVVALAADQPREIPPKSAWTIEDYSNGQLSDEYVVENLIDGTSAAWHTGTKITFPMSLVINFGSLATVNGIIYTPRHGDDGDTNASPIDVTFEISEDKINWTTVIVAKLPSGKSVTADTNIPLDEPTTGQYLRWTIIKNDNGASYTYAEELTVY
ncbi:MAG: DUF1735 domain-containing protein [Bacteroidales bacterium]|jgi:hypothetical protein|nr:DUF1735 domain-containing protein [Bacteroidales bacterium]